MKVLSDRAIHQQEEKRAKQARQQAERDKQKKEKRTLKKERKMMGREKAGTKVISPKSKYKKRTKK